MEPKSKGSFLFYLHKEVYWKVIIFFLCNQEIAEVNKIYTPSQADVDSSLQILEAAKAHGIEKGGVIKLNGKMIDIPLIDKAERIVKLAIASGMIKESK